MLNKCQLDENLPCDPIEVHPYSCVSMNIVPTTGPVLNTDNPIKPTAAWGGSVWSELHVTHGEAEAWKLSDLLSLLCLVSLLITSYCGHWRLFSLPDWKLQGCVWPVYHHVPGAQGSAWYPRGSESICGMQASDRSWGN